MNRKNDLNDQKMNVMIDDLIFGSSLSIDSENPLSALCIDLMRTRPEVQDEFKQGLFEKMTRTWNQNTFARQETAGKQNNLRRVPGFSFSKLVIGLVIVLLLTIAFVPPVRTVVAESIQSIILGDSTYVWNTITAPTQEKVLDDSEIWKIKTDIGNFGGNDAPGVDIGIFLTNTFEEAQAFTDYQLWQPTELPVGYLFNKAEIAPIGNPKTSILTYSGPGNDIIIVQMRTGAQEDIDENTGLAYGTSLIMDGSIELVNFDGKPAVWIEETSLLWETDGFSFQVGSLNSSIEEMMRIARSLH